VNPDTIRIRIHNPGKKYIVPKEELFHLAATPDEHHLGAAEHLLVNLQHIHLGHPVQRVSVVFYSSTQIKSKSALFVKMVLATKKVFKERPQQ
jgi:hypothetical protein